MSIRHTLKCLRGERLRVRFKLNAGTFNPINSRSRYERRASHASRAPCRFDRRDEPRNLISESRAVKPYIVCARYGRKESVSSRLASPRLSSLMLASRDDRPPAITYSLRKASSPTMTGSSSTTNTYAIHLTSPLSSSARTVRMTMRRALARIFIDLSVSHSRCVCREWVRDR